MIFSAFFPALFALYLHFGLLPAGLKQRAVEAIEDSCELRVSFDKLLVLPFSGINFYNLKVMDKAGRPIFSSKKMSADVRLVPFFKENKIVVRSVRLDSPRYDLSLTPRRVVPPPPPIKTKISGQIDVPVLPDNPPVKLSDSIEQGPDFFLPENVYLEQIEITDGTVVVRADAASEAIETIHSINVRMGFHRPPYLTFDGSLRLGENPYGHLSLRGTWDLQKANYEFYFQAQSWQIPAWLVAYQKKNFLILQEGGFKLNAHILSSTEERAVFHVLSELDQATLALGKTRYDGQMALDARGIFNFGTRRFAHYEGTLELANVQVTHLSKDIEHLDRVTGKIHFEPDRLVLDAVKGQYKDIPFTARGDIRSFKQPALDVEIESRADIQQLLALLPDKQKQFIKNFDIGGQCKAVTVIRGPLRKPEALEKTYKLLLEDGFLKARGNAFAMEGLSCEIQAGADGFKITGARFTWQKQAYAMNAFFPQEPGKPGSMELKSQLFELKADYLLKDNEAQVQSGTLSWEGLWAKFQGRVSDFSRPHLDLRGDLQIALGSMKKFLTERAPALKDLGLRGELAGSFTLNGFGDNPMGWDLKIDATANPLFIKEKLALKDFEIQVRMKDKILNIPYIHANPYGGTFGARVLLDLSQPGPLFDTRVSANNLDLGRMVRDLDLENKNIEGKAIFQTVLRGRADKPESFIGEGAISIAEGQLWETDLFKKMGELVFVKVEGLDRVVFHSLSGTFKVQDKKIWTKDLTLNSETVDLSLRGSIDFDQSLDFLMDIQYSRDVMRGALATGGLVPFVVQEAGSMISQYKVSGTLSKPKYDKAGLDATKILTSQISGIFQTLTR